MLQNNLSVALDATISKRIAYDQFVDNNWESYSLSVCVCFIGGAKISFMHAQEVCTSCMGFLRCQFTTETLSLITDPNKLCCSMGLLLQHYFTEVVLSQGSYSCLKCRL